MGCSSEAKKKDVIRISLTEILKGTLGPCSPNVVRSRCVS